MKKTIIRVSCLALLGLLAASCQKEFPVEQPISAEQLGILSIIIWL